MSGSRLENMIERNRSDCEYVKIFTHRVGSTGAPSRRTVFITATNNNRQEFPHTASRNIKTIIFQEGSAGFKVTMNVSFYIKNVDSISLRQKYNCMGG
jgi:hypothetical protein